MQSPDLLTPDAYQAQLLALVERSRSRIALSAMVGLYEPLVTGPIIDAIETACDRGVQVHLLFDIFSFSPIAEGPFAIGPRFYSRRAAIKAALRRLQAKGARVSLVGQKRLNPYKGRYHAKITVVDDHYFCFGGINFTAESFSSYDYMLGADDRPVADYLWGLLDRFASGQVADDISHPLDGHNTLLFDAGQPGHSIIYETAVRLAAQARHIIYVSQMTPSHTLATHIKATDAACYFNRPSQPSFPTSLGQYVDQKRYGIHNRYKGATYIHAKYMLFDLPGGRKAIISGSNNFSWRGVAYGTQEIALYSTDRTLYDQLMHFTDTRISAVHVARDLIHKR